MKSFQITFTIILIISCALVTTACPNEEREVLVEAAIENVREDFAAQEKAAKLHMTSPGEKLHSYKKATAEALAQGNARVMFEKMVKAAETKILRRQQATMQSAEERAESLAMEFLHKPGSILTKQEIDKIYEASGCREIVHTPMNCSSLSNQRTPNGLCNNLKHPTFGAANTPMRRLIPAQYDDGISRLQGMWQILRLSIVPGPFSPPNPSPRVVSLSVIKDRPLNDSQFSHILMQWGQFIDHDLHVMPEFEECPPGCTIKEESCVPFPVPEDDTKIKVSRVDGDVNSCHIFRRTIPACEESGSEPESLTVREQINGLTHFIDGSMVYHHDPQIQMNLIRNKSNPDGLLNVGPPVRGTSRPSLPCINNSIMDVACPSPPCDQSPCIELEEHPNIVACPNPPCFVAGDYRVNEHTALITMHTIWLREHNRVAQIIRAGNPQMTSDEIFQTTRNIIIAEIQKITYKDYLPIILGNQLIPEYAGYNESIYPNIPNAFATAAYRFGHSQIQPFFDRLDENYRSIPAGPLPLMNAFFDATQFLENEGTDPILRGLLTRNARLVDEFMNSILTNCLFCNSTTRHGLDLASLDIQRGRDHGLPGYLTWKQWALEECGIESDFRNQLTQIHLLQTYGSLRNVDLFVGGLAEEPLPGGLIGAVFACIFKHTFSAVRDGDRFYYENLDLGIFTSSQIEEIENASLSRVICDNSDIMEIQQNAFMANQDRVSCSEIPSMNLSKWENITPTDIPPTTIPPTTIPPTTIPPTTIPPTTIPPTTIPTTTIQPTTIPPPPPDFCSIKIKNNMMKMGTGMPNSINFSGCSVGTAINLNVQSGSTGCLIFSCPKLGGSVTLAIKSNVSCGVKVNPNLSNVSHRRDKRWIMTLTASDIVSENGLYHNGVEGPDNCIAGENVGITYCVGDVSLADNLEDIPDGKNQEEEEDSCSSDDQLLQNFSQDGNDVKNDKLISLIEEVLTRLKAESLDNTLKDKTDEKKVQENSFAALEEAIEHLN